MSADVRIVVVGGGVLGLSTALTAAELSAGRNQIVVLEQATLASGSSGLSVGVVGTQFVERHAMELRAHGLERFGELERDEHIPMARIGYLRLAPDEESIEGFRAAVDAQRRLGITGPAVLLPDEIQVRVPDLDMTGVAAALYGPSDGYTDGHLVCMAYASKATNAGVEIRQKCRLIEHEKTSSGTHVLRTSRGTVECDLVVNAAGAWAQAVGEQLDVHVPLVPQRHQTCIARPAHPLGYVMPLVMNYVARENDFGLYFRQEGEGQLVVGLHTESLDMLPIEDPDDWNRGVSPEFVELVAERLAHKLPRLHDMGLGPGWSGLYPNSPDGRPIIGPHAEDPTVIAAAGGGSSGIQLSPVIGKVAAEWAVHGNVTTIDFAGELSPARFARTTSSTTRRKEASRKW